MQKLENSECSPEITGLPRSLAAKDAPFASTDLRTELTRRAAACAGTKPPSKPAAPPVGPSPYDVSGDWAVVWNWSVTAVTFVGTLSGSGESWQFDGKLTGGGNAVWHPEKGSAGLTCTLTGKPGAHDADGKEAVAKMSCTATFGDGNWQGQAEGALRPTSGNKRKFEFRGRGQGTNAAGGAGGIDHLDLTPVN
jgi:hypothetical protein